jgi:predicted transposase/invertase (TIGR01784 family)
MQDYDAALKLLLQGSAEALMLQVVGVTITRWLTAELPQVQTTRADLLGETADGTLVHIEIQSTNDALMALRMAEYALRIYRQFRKFPRQVVLYVGQLPMRMNSVWKEPDFSYQYALLDIRDLDTKTLLNSPHIEENVLAILTRLHDKRATVRKILSKIVVLDESAKRTAYAQLLVISGLRRMEETITQEERTMPVTEDIRNHAIIGPALRQGHKEGHKEGRHEALLETADQLLTEKFGPLPSWVEPRVAGLSAPELQRLISGVLRATRLEDILPTERPKRNRK